MFNGESVIDAVPHSENSPFLLHFLLDQTLLEHLVLIFRTKRRRACKGHREIAISVKNHSRWSRNSQRIGDHYDYGDVKILMG
jgi:hypothetical protein